MCKRCGFSYHNPTLSKRELTRLYDCYRDEFFRKESPDEYFDRITSLPHSESQNYKKTLRLDQLLEKYCGSLKGDKKNCIYDVCTGCGVFVKTFLDHSRYAWQAFGLEPTPAYAALAKRRLSIPIANSFYRPRIFERKFDLITANKVLEHSEDPIGFLRGLREDLDIGGMIYIEVPSVREVVTLPHDHPQLGYDHLMFFSKETLGYMAKKAGLLIHELNEVIHENGEVDLLLVATRNEDDDGSDVDVAFPLNVPQDFFRNI